MRKLFTMLILIFLFTTSMYLLGVFSRSPIDAVFDLGSVIKRMPVAGPGHELNSRGIEELNAGNPGNAVANLEEAHRLEPDNAVIRRNLSIALARWARENPENEDEAINILDESLELWPENPEGLDGLSTIHFKAARYEEALGPALKLKELMPERDDLAQYVSHLEKRVADEKGMSSEMGDRFRLLYSEEKRLEYSGEILAILQTQLDSLSVDLGIFPDKPIEVLLLTKDLGTRADPLDPFLEGLYDGQIRLYVGDGIKGREKDKLIRTVRHEMVHALLHQAVGDLPGWVHEGLAQISGEKPDHKKLDKLKRYLADSIRDGYKVDLAAMGASFINLNDESRTRAYASSLLFMDYLSGGYGNGFIPTFISEISTGSSPEAALETLTGQSFTRLQQSFSSHLVGSF